MTDRKMPANLPLTIATVASAGLLGMAAWSWTRPATAVRRAFRAWGTGEGSIYDLMDADAEVVVPGSAPHCGTWRKEAFLRDVATPFVARFAEPPVPRLWALWAGADGIIVRADATGTTLGGHRYANDYVFLFEMEGQRVTKVTEFLDMAAFNAVWDSVEPEAAHGE